MKQNGTHSEPRSVVSTLKRLAISLATWATSSGWYGRVDRDEGENGWRVGNTVGPYADRGAAKRAALKDAWERYDND